MTNKKIIDREQEISFTNFSEEDFEITYDHGRMGGEKGNVWIPNRKLYVFEAKKTYLIPYYLAEVFAKHLTDKEYNKAFQKELNIQIQKAGAGVSREVIEHRVMQVIGFTKQFSMNKCVELQDEENSIVPKPQKIRMKEVLLYRDERAAEIEAEFGNVGSVYNREAVKQANKEESKDEFE